MRRAFVIGPAVAVALALAIATGETATKTPPPPKAAATAPAPPADAYGDGMDAMDGPDAWDQMDMDPAGYVESARGPGGPGGPGGRRYARRQEIMKELNLTDAQREKIDAIREKQQRGEIDQEAKLKIARLDLRSLLRADKTDRGAVNSKIDEIARMQAQLRKDQIGSMLDQRAVLTPEQQQKLRSYRPH